MNIEKVSSFDRMRGTYPQGLQPESFFKKLIEQGGKRIEGEAEKTEQEKRIIDIMNAASNRIRNRYGLENFDVPPDNIHVLTDLPNHPVYGPEMEETGGFFIQQEQVIILGSGQHPLTFAEAVLHEMVHFKSFGVADVQFDDFIFKDADFRYREGFKMRDTKTNKLYFEVIDEALTQEEIKRELEMLKTNDPEIAALTVETQELVEDFSGHMWDEDDVPVADDLLRAEIDPSDDNIILERYRYSKERAVLHLLIEKIYSRNAGRFSTPEEIYAIFMMAKMNGKMLPVARLIETTFGEGTFRKIGSYDTTQTAQLRAYIESI